MTAHPVGDDARGLWLSVAAVLALAGAGLLGAGLLRQRAPAPRFPAALIPAAAAYRDADEAPRQREVLVRHTLGALAAGDVDEAAAAVHPDVSWAATPPGEVVKGRDAFREHWSQRLAGRSVQFQVLRFDGDDEGVTVEMNELVRDWGGSGPYGSYPANRRFTFRDGLIAGTTTHNARD